MGSVLEYELNFYTEKGRGRVFVLEFGQVTILCGVLFLRDVHCENFDCFGRGNGVVLFVEIVTEPRKVRNLYGFVHLRNYEVLPDFLTCFTYFNATIISLFKMSLFYTRKKSIHIPGNGF